MRLTPENCKSELFVSLIEELKRSPIPEGMRECFLRHRFIRLWQSNTIDYAFNDWSLHVSEPSLVQAVRLLVEEIKTSGHQNRPR